MDPDLRGHEPLGDHGLLDPEHHVVAGPPVVIPEVVVEADDGHPARLQQTDGLVRPVDPFPARRRVPLVVEKHLEPGGRLGRPLLGLLPQELVRIPRGGLAPSKGLPNGVRKLSCVGRKIWVVEQKSDPKSPLHLGNLAALKPELLDQGSGVHAFAGLAEHAEELLGLALGHPEGHLPEPSLLVPVEEPEVGPQREAEVHQVEHEQHGLGPNPLLHAGEERLVVSDPVSNHVEEAEPLHLRQSLLGGAGILEQRVFEDARHGVHRGVPQLAEVPLDGRLGVRGELHPVLHDELDGPEHPARVIGERRVRVRRALHPPVLEVLETTAGEVEDLRLVRPLGQFEEAPHERVVDHHPVRHESRLDPFAHRDVEHVLLPHIFDRRDLDVLIAEIEQPLELGELVWADDLEARHEPVKVPSGMSIVEKPLNLPNRLMDIGKGSEPIPIPIRGVDGTSASVLLPPGKEPPNVLCGDAVAVAGLVAPPGVVEPLGDHPRLDLLPQESRILGVDVNEPILYLAQDAVGTKEHLQLLADVGGSRAEGDPARIWTNRAVPLQVSSKKRPLASLIGLQDGPRDGLVVGSGLAVLGPPAVQAEVFQPSDHGLAVGVDVVAVCAGNKFHPTQDADGPLLDHLVAGGLEPEGGVETLDVAGDEGRVRVAERHPLVGVRPLGHDAPD